MKHCINSKKTATFGVANKTILVLTGLNLKEKKIKSKYYQQQRMVTKWEQNRKIKVDKNLNLK